MQSSHAPVSDPASAPAQAVPIPSAQEGALAIRGLMAVSALPLIGLFGLAAEGLFFQAAAETELTRTAVWTESMETEEVSILADGEETTDAPGVESSVESTLSVTTVDRFVRTKMGGPLELVRLFDDITYESEGKIGFDSPSGPIELEISGEGESALDQIAVKFDFDGEADEWVKSYAEEYEGQEELLEPLWPNAEFLRLLPEDPEDVEVGDRWEVDGDALLDLLVPGGYVPMERASDLQVIEGVLDPLLLPGPFALMDGDIEGKVLAKLDSMTAKSATITLEVEVDVTKSCIDLIQGIVNGIVPEGARIEVNVANYAMALKGKGSLVWDLEGYHMKSFEFTSDAEIEILMEVLVDLGGEATLYELRETRSGEVGLTVE